MTASTETNRLASFVKWNIGVVFPANNKSAKSLDDTSTVAEVSELTISVGEKGISKPAERKVARELIERIA